MFSLRSSLIRNALTKSISHQSIRTYLTQDTPRFFMVSYQFGENTHSERAYHLEEHNKKVKALEANGKIVFGGTAISQESLYLLFNCKDETVPYDFVKADPLYTNGTITEYKIDEVELGVKEDVTQITKYNQYR